MKPRLSATLLALTATACLLLALAPAASASDGVILITQATATRGLPNCPNDGQSFITICQSGSYRLAGNLAVPFGLYEDAGIAIDADDVTLDLNGFTIQADAEQGEAVFSNHSRVTVKDGVVDANPCNGCTGGGVELDGNDEAILGISVYSYGGLAIQINNGLLHNCRVSSVPYNAPPDYAAIDVIGTATVDGCTVLAEDSVGILVRNGNVRIRDVDMYAFGGVTGVKVNQGAVAQITGSTISGTLEADGRVVASNNVLTGSVTGTGLVSLHNNVCSGGSIC